MKKNEKNSFGDILIQTEVNIVNDIINSIESLTKNKSMISLIEIENWKKCILSNIRNEFEKLNKSILQTQNDMIIETNNKEEYYINNKNELDNYTSRDIESENKEITRNFQNQAYNYMNSNEKIENENVALFLRKVAQLSRIAYNEGKKLFIIMKKNYAKIKEINENNISLNDENIKKEYSSWVKNLEKEKGKIIYENILNQDNPLGKNENIKENQILSKIFNDLSLMYFHCNLSFPSINIDFNTEETFNTEKMIDFINRGKNRKVNFVILPSLISNGSFLQNGKAWVFTYYKDTFKFTEQINESLNELIEKEKPSLKYIKENLKIDVYCHINNGKKNIIISKNIDIPESFNYEYVFYFRDTKNNTYFKMDIKNNFEIDITYEIVKYEFKLENEIIKSSCQIYNK